MKSLGEWLGWSVRSISPDDISGCMLQRSKYNLNELSHDAAIYLIQSALNRGVNVTEVYVDTVGSPEKYQQKLAQYFPGLKITVAKKADSLYPSVSAASIAAKVTRDLQLKNWLFQEHLEGKIDIEFGSGYPAGTV
jgi:ribonuclease H2 subunit A